MVGEKLEWRGQRKPEEFDFVVGIFCGAAGKGGKVAQAGLAGGEVGAHEEVCGGCTLGQVAK